MKGEESLTVKRGQWNQYSLLRLIQSGSDLDGERAFFVSDIDLAAHPEASQIRIEALTRAGNWVAIEGGTFGSFPSRGWASAGVSWYQRESLFGTDPDDHLEFRAIIPLALTAGDRNGGKILCQPGDGFESVAVEELLPRLRLDPSLGTVYLLEEPFTLYIDGEPVDDIDITSTLGAGPNDGELCSWGNGGEIGGRCDIYGGWLHLCVPEISDEYTWIGLDVDLSELARERIVDGLNAWEPEESDRVELTSPYLDVNNPTDVEWVRSVAPGATLNGFVVT